MELSLCIVYIMYDTVFTSYVRLVYDAPCLRDVYDTSLRFVFFLSGPPNLFKAVI